MKKYLYYRLYITKFCRDGAQQNFASIAEFALFDTNNTNIARLSGCTYNQNSIGESKPASMAFDNNASTFWHANYSPGTAINWIYVKLPEPLTAVRCGIIPRSDNWNDFPYNFEVQGSEDGNAWETLLSKVNQSSWTKNAYNYFDLDIPTSSLYLLGENETFYTVVNNVLTELTDVTELTKSVFETYGLEELPNWTVFSSLVDPIVYQWASDEIQEMTATEVAVPFPQTLTSTDYDMTDETITGIDHVEVELIGDILFSISFDEGTTWKIFSDDGWETVTDANEGMTAEILTAIESASWDEIAITGKFRFRIYIPDENASLTTLIVKYKND